MKLIPLTFFLILFIAPSLVFSKTKCLINEEIKLPQEALFFLFNTNGIRAIPFPLECKLTTNSIKVINLNNEYIGLFKVKKIASSPVDSLYVRTKQASPELKKFYSLMSKYLDFNNFIFFMLDLQKNTSSYIRQGTVSIAFGYMSDLQNDRIKWKPYSPNIKHWAAKTINYSQLLKLYSNQKTEFYSISNTKHKVKVDRMNIVQPEHLPKTIFNKKLVSNDKNFKYDFPSITNLIKYRTWPQKQNPIVILSRSNETIQAYNTITDMYAKGVKRIYWFNNSYENWTTFKPRDPFTSIPQSDILSPEKLENLLYNKKTLQVYDISDPESYNVMKITRAVPLAPNYISKKTLKKKYIKRLGFKNLKKSDYKYIFDGGYEISNKALHDSKGKEIILIGNRNDEPSKIKFIRSRFLETGTKKVYIVLESKGQIAEKIFYKNNNLPNYFTPSTYLFKHL